jgi:hypothetical protein
MGKIEAIGDIVKTGGQIADDLTESGEERQEALTHRHEMDMVNGTWLTRNVRPLTLLVLLFYWVVAIPLMQSFGVAVSDAVINAVEMLSLTAFGFYFGSKGFEKVQVIKAKSERKEIRQARRDMRRRRRDAKN